MECGTDLNWIAISVRLCDKRLPELMKKGTPCQRQLSK